MLFETVFVSCNGVVCGCVGVVSWCFICGEKENLLSHEGFVH